MTKIVKKNILFRADGNSEIGLGHLYRLLALAEMLKDKYECVFLTKKNISNKVFNTSFKIYFLPNAIEYKSEPRWIKKYFKEEEYIIILDGYQFNYDYQMILKRNGYFLIYIDDFATERMCANLVINHSLAAKTGNYSYEDYTQFALGTKYALLRPLFLDAAAIPRTIYKTDSCLVCFGGSDKENFTERAVKALLKIDKIKKIYVVLGVSNKNNHDLINNSKKVQVFKNLKESELIRVFNLCNIAIVPSSTILYEVCSVKMPVLSGYYTDNQKMLYQGMLEKSAIFDGGCLLNYSTDDFESNVLELIAEQNKHKFIVRQSELFDGSIRRRINSIIDKELKLNNIKIRSALSTDVDLTFQWTNEEQVRFQSFSSNLISFETHSSWFEKKLLDRKSIMYILEFDKRPSGLVKFDLKKEGAIIGISVDKGLRGQGLGSLFIEKATREYFKSHSLHILAYIKNDNIKSIKSFEKAGFDLFKNDNMNDIDIVVYKLNDLNNV